VIVLKAVHNPATCTYLFIAFCLIVYVLGLLFNLKAPTNRSQIFATSPLRRQHSSGQKLRQIWFRKLEWYIGSDIIFNRDSVYVKFPYFVSSPQYGMWMHHIFVIFYNMLLLSESSSDICIVYLRLCWSASIPTLVSVYKLEYCFFSNTYCRYKNGCLLLRLNIKSYNFKSLKLISEY
jgi:hypothetical protein